MGEADKLLCADTLKIEDRMNQYALPNLIGGAAAGYLIAVDRRCEQEKR